MPHLGLAAPRLDEVALDGRVLAAMGVATLATGLLFGIAPAWRGSRSDVRSAMQDAGRSGRMGLGRSRLQAGLVTAEMTLSTVLTMTVNIAE